MKIKKIIILIAFVAISLFAGNAYAAGPVEEGATTTAQTVIAQNTGTVLPQIYGNENDWANYQPGTLSTQNSNTTATTQTTSGATTTQQIVAPAPYMPTSPIIFNGDGTYTEQFTGKTSGTKTSTTNNSSSTGTQTTSTTSSSTSDTGLLSGIFGSKKNIFSNNVTSTSTSQVSTDQNLQALVNSKGLAMGTNGTMCSNTNATEYVILYKNITGQELTNVAVRISLPTGIVPTNTGNGAYSERDNTVTIFLGTLAVKQEGQILIGTKTTGTVSGVARTEMVYTLPNQNQDMIVSYAFGNTCGGTALGASAVGSGGALFGGTLLGWLFLALFVSAFIYLIRFFLIKKNDSHGHGHAAAHAH